MPDHDKLSAVSIRCRPVPMVDEWMSGVYNSSDTWRSPETKINRAFVTATYNTTYDPDFIKCSNCGKRKHFTDFNKNSTYTWRFGREYDCRECRKGQRLRGVSIDPADEKYLRSQPNKRRKKIA